MADIAGQVSSFLSLATTWYNSATARLTAQATLQVRLTNFDLYHDHIAGVVTKVFEVNSRLAPQQVELLNQAIWVLHLDESLRQWLSYAGFGPKRTYVTTVVRRGGRAGTPVYQRRKRARGGGRKLPWIGVSGKQVAFETLFGDLQTAFERLETMMCSEAYLNTDQLKIVGSMAPARLPSGPRGGGDPSDDDGNAAFAYAQKARGRRATDKEIVAELSLRQKVRQDRSLQILSERLEGGISDMLRSMGKEDALRARRANRARADHLRREVVQEQALSLAEIDEMALRDSELKDEQELLRLRKARRARILRRYAEAGDEELSEEGSITDNFPRPKPQGPPGPRGPAPSSRGVGRDGETREFVYKVAPIPVPPVTVSVRPEAQKKGKMKAKETPPQKPVLVNVQSRVPDPLIIGQKLNKSKGKLKATQPVAAAAAVPRATHGDESSSSSESTRSTNSRKASGHRRGYWVRHRDDRLELRIATPR